MFTIISSEATDIKVVDMKDMKPLEIGKICGDCDLNGSFVMRTASTDKFEVMDLSHPGEDVCWTGCCDLSVRLLHPSEYVTMTLFNEPKKED